ncbi:MAG: glycosyltransferase family 4 protein [Promethearchaeota archaeon]
MKILRISPFPPSYTGGVQLYAKNLSINLALRKNIKSDILTTNIFNEDKKVETIDKGVRLLYKNDILFIKKQMSYPVVNLFGFIKKKYDDYDLIHAHGYHFLTTTQCSFLKRIYKFPMILHIHGGIETPIYPTLKISEKIPLIFKNKVFDPLVGKFHLKSADKVISVSSRDLHTIREKFKIDNNHSCHIPDGIDIHKFKKNDQFEKKYITFIGRLGYIKGIDLFLKIINDLYKKNQDLKFLIIGEGPMKAQVLEAKKKLPIEYHEKYPYNRIQDVYNQSLALLVTSRSEGVPNTIYESLACETPVVSSDVGGIPEVLTDNVNGALFKVGDYKKSVDIILKYLKDRDKLLEMGKNGRKIVENKYSWEVITEKITQIYRSLLETSR